MSNLTKVYVNIIVLDLGQINKLSCRLEYVRFSQLSSQLLGRSMYYYVNPSLNYYLHLVICNDGVTELS